MSQLTLYNAASRVTDPVRSGPNGAADSTQSVAAQRLPG